MHYLVDGYNFLFRISQKEQSLEKRRKHLIELLNEELWFLRGRCSLIFDSSEQVRNFPECASLENIEVIYTPKGLDADLYILELVEQRRTPKAVTVVTSDNPLRRQCRDLGAQIMTIETFISFIGKKTRRKEHPKLPLPFNRGEMERLRKIFENRLEKEE